LKHIARRTPGKKYISGAGERGTSKTCCYCYKWKAKLGWAKVYRCSNARCRKVFDRDAGSAKNNTMERAQYEKAREEAAELERQLAERAAEEEAERERVVSARAERASRRERESEVSARAERARKRAQEAERRGRRSLRQRTE